MKQQQKQAEKDGSVLDHIGVLDGTFIYPTGKNLPSLISNPRGRFTIEVKRIWTAVLDWGASLVMRVWVVRPKMWSGKKLERGKVVGIATEIYEEMYTGLAKGDLRLVEQDLKPGLLASLRSRLAQRAPNSGMLWKLHGYTSRPKVMSFKFITLPGGSDEEKNGVVQAVVRLRSKQSLVKVQKVRTKDETGRAVMRAVPVDEAGVPVPEAGMEELMERNSKVTTEYVVLQRMMKKGKFERWQMWGTAEESSLAKLERDHRDAVAKQEQMAQMRGQT
jgi:protein MBA1